MSTRRYILFSIFLFLPIAHADTIHVPDNYSTIQQGIDAAVNGDSILVAPGTYVENISFYGKAIIVKGSSGPDVTIIDGNQVGKVVTFNNGEGKNSVLDGFTVTNGDGYQDGGGVYCIHASPTIKNNIITGNMVPKYGGGIHCSFSQPVIENNTISGNTAEYGGGISCYDSSPTITNNTISGNTANNDGGGIYCGYNSSPIITNTILWGNSATTGAEIYIGTQSNPSALIIIYSDVKGGKDSVHIEPGSALLWGPGMIDANPLFIDPANGDFHLTVPSPCKDTGDNSAVTELYDFEGDPRITYGIVDMGADEFHRHLYCMGDMIPGGFVEVKLIGKAWTKPVGLWFGFGILDLPLKTKWGDWYLEYPFIGPIDLGIMPPGGVLTLSGCLPAAPAHYSIPMQALIGAELTNLCVLEIE